MKYICKKSSNQEIFSISLSHAVVIMQILNWTNQCSLFMTVRNPRTVTHARDH
jgi:hypothetical protein